MDYNFFYYFPKKCSVLKKYDQNSRESFWWNWQETDKPLIVVRFGLVLLDRWALEQGWLFCFLVQYMLKVMLQIMILRMESKERFFEMCVCVCVLCIECVSLCCFIGRGPNYRLVYMWYMIIAICINLTSVCMWRIRWFKSCTPPFAAHISSDWSSLAVCLLWLAKPNHMCALIGQI